MARYCSSLTGAFQKNENPAQLQPIGRAYEQEQIKCQGMKVKKAESDYEQPIMKDIKNK